MLALQAYSEKICDSGLSQIIYDLYLHSGGEPVEDSG
jgi:hypothetical protein